MATISNYLDRYFEPVNSVFTPELAKKIVGLQAESDVAARILTLGEKATAGTLTEEERDEYQDYVDAGDFIALLKAKVRRWLACASWVSDGCPDAQIHSSASQWTLRVLSLARRG